jgi:hypothetical protein
LLYQQALNVLLSTSSEYANECIAVGTTCSYNDPSKITYGGHTRKGGLLHPNKHHLACDFFNGNIVLVPQSVYRKVGSMDSMP